MEADFPQEKSEKQTEAHKDAKTSFALLSAGMSIASAAIGIAINIPASYLAEYLGQGQYNIWGNYLLSIHWSLYLISGVFLYTLVGVIFEKFEMPSLMRSAFKIPTWVELKSFGNQQVAKVSYIGLAAIPFIIYFVKTNPFKIEPLTDLDIPLNMKITFFIAFFFSLALISFVVGCPKEFQAQKGIASGGKYINLLVQNADRSILNLSQEEDVFYDPEIDRSRLFLRYICWTLYSSGLVLSVSLLFRSAILVVNA